jgi:EAL and modified HD-GYP domain-containing signal transduction protein
MYVHIARQPIFNVHRQLFAYELLFRRTLGMNLGELSGERATSSLLSTTFLTEDIDRIASNRPCFVNFTGDLLVRGIPGFFPSSKIIIEVLEDVCPTAEVIGACRLLHGRGYQLALDDFAYDDCLLPLIELASIIKIDYRLTPAAEIEQLLLHLARFNLKYLAEKVETYEEFEHARALGFHYFQGYFFARPQSLHLREVNSLKVNQIRLLTEINRPELSAVNLERIISSDVAIAYKLLRLINSAYFSLVSKVASIRRAIIYLGETEIRRFVMLVIVSNLAAEKPQELLRLSVVRARFCELLAERGTLASHSPELFLLGLFSLLDAILDAPMETIMAAIPIVVEVKEAIVDHSGPFAFFLEAMTAWEEGRVEDCLVHWQRMGVAAEEVAELYLEAIRFTRLID